MAWLIAVPTAIFALIWALFCLVAKADLVRE